MPVALVMDFPGGTKDNYDNVIARMELGGQMPAGGLFHAAGPTADGWRVVDVWESMEQFQRFAEERIMPLTAAEGMAPPNVRHVDVHNVMEGDRSADVVFAQVVRVDGADEATYDAVNARVSPGNKAPDGCVYHIGGPVEGGWCVIDGWTANEARDRVLDTVGPALRDAGFDAPPQIEELDVERTLRAGSGAAA
jgi:hypothetical protein